MGAGLFPFLSPHPESSISLFRTEIQDAHFGRLEREAFAARGQANQLVRRQWDVAPT